MANGFSADSREFQRRRPVNGRVISIKVRIEGGFFHRAHSPEAFKIIGGRLRRLPDDVEVIEHESGLELILYLAVATGVLSLAKSVVELVTEIFKARSAGIKKGDHPREPLVLIDRRVDEKNEYREEIVLRLGHKEKVDSGEIEDRLNAAIQEMFKDEK